MIEQIRRIFEEYQPELSDPNHNGRDRAGVLIPLITDGPIRMTLTQRAGSLDTHGGEVAFPGGREDEGDGSITSTALRETEEEVGVARHQVEVIGELKPFVSKFGLSVTSIVGVLPGNVVYRLNPDEIASVFEVPLEFFLKEKPIRLDDIDRHGEAYTVPAFEFDGYEIWGLTSLIIQEFLDVAGLQSRR